MDLSAVGGDVSEETWKYDLGGEEKGKARQQLTGHGLGRAHEHQGKMYPPRGTKFNVQGCDLPGVKWQRYCSIPKPTSSCRY